ncbi:MAG: SRPBCC family protein [Acidimicrobiales bacterium]|nr:SRPBCC family protein [Acidimicrobiales bacterium]
MTDTTTGRSEITIGRPPAEVFAAIADITRMGEWSPETVACRWLGDGRGVGATFEGDNLAALGPITLKKWTTVSEVTAFKEGVVFEFVTEDTTTWRFDFSAVDDGTRVVQSFSHPPTTGIKRVMYNAFGSRRKAMVAGMGKTLGRVKAALES